MVAVHWKDRLHHVQQIKCRFIRITTYDASAKYSMPRELQSTLDTFGITWPALSNQIPCRAHVVHLALGTFMNRLGVDSCTKSWEADERDLQFGENVTAEIGKSQRLQKEGPD
jgi:hypothetical protein